MRVYHSAAGVIESCLNISAVHINGPVQLNAAAEADPTDTSMKSHTKDPISDIPPKKFDKLSDFCISAGTLKPSATAHTIRVRARPKLSDSGNLKSVH